MSSQHDEKDLSGQLSNTHDLRLPEWGPYAKKFMGVSHITDPARGIRFEFSMMPGLHHRRVDPPNARRECGYHPWEASPDLTYYSHRHELEWKDRLYCDISSSTYGSGLQLMRCDCVNNTDFPRDLQLLLLGGLYYPQSKVVTVQEGTDVQRIGALDYREMVHAIPEPTDSLVYDNLLRGELLDDECCGGSGLQLKNGDQAAYQIDLAARPTALQMKLRFRMKAGSEAVLHFRGLFSADVPLNGTDEMADVLVPLETSADHAGTLTLVNHGDTVLLDAFFVGSASAVAATKVLVSEPEVTPEMIECPIPQSLFLKYPGIEPVYGMWWSCPDYLMREFTCDPLEPTLHERVHNHGRRILDGPGNGHQSNVQCRPIHVKAKARQIVYALIGAGSYDDIFAALKSADRRPVSLEQAYERARSKTLRVASTPAGESFRFSQDLMAATTLTNVVYPIYTKRSYIRHYTPGRWWDTLYTWDAGFCGLGLAQLDTERAIDCLNAYVTEPGDPQAAFVHHGTPVPVQHYLFMELWNRTQRRDLLEYFYPRLKQYHAFLAGRLGSSTTRNLKSHLLRTWDYFYNSGGWDDYPAQEHVMHNHLEATIAPAGNTAHAIRTAKFLRMAAEALDRDEDLAAYDADIETFTAALERHAWDDEAGYYSYVEHDADGNPVGILKHESGVNFNMGLDGILPLVAGTCQAERRDRLLKHLEDENEIMTPIGLCAVDQSAPYYTPNGYWNGAVWMPHQWFLWKACLDVGRGDLAREIAARGLAVWRKEVGESYYCFEHFIVASERGAGWHHFSGLSSPVLAWFAAYYQPGRLTGGHDTWIDKLSWAEDYSSLDAQVRFFNAADHPRTVLAVMAPQYQYKVLWNDKQLPFSSDVAGQLEIAIPPMTSAGTLSIKQLS